MAEWKISEVLEYVEHPERRVRCGPKNNPELEPFQYVNQLGIYLSKFSAEDQKMYVDNFIDTLDQFEPE